MSIDTLIAFYVASLLLTLGFVVLYSELRRKRFEPQPSEDHIFRCGKCGFVYTDDPDVDRSRCPQCGCMNEVITF
jgi:rubrerythrin